jgi:protease-4
LLSRGEINNRLLEIVGGTENEASQFSGIGYDSYLAHVRTGLALPDGENRVAVVTLSGTILDGREGPGSIGGDSAADLIRSVTRDDEVKALVLRVDSPGGSAFASEIILSELEAYQKSGRPLVVSMGSVAASGGYWISMSADQIWASATTITGSIGVGAVIPTFPRTLDKVGIHIDGIGTTELTGQFSQARGLGNDAKTYIGETVQALYGEFVGKVAEHRKREFAEIEAVAQGRVWSGQDAHEFGLVDEIGGLKEAVASAAALAGLAQGGYSVDFIEPTLTVTEQLVLQFMQTAAPVLQKFHIEWPWPGELAATIAAAVEPLESLQEMRDPRGLYAFCFCDVE